MPAMPRTGLQKLWTPTGHWHGSRATTNYNAVADVLCPQQKLYASEMEMEETSGTAFSQCEGFPAPQKVQRRWVQWEAIRLMHLGCQCCKLCKAMGTACCYRETAQPSDSPGKNVNSNQSLKEGLAAFQFRFSATELHLQKKKMLVETSGSYH